MGLIMWLNVPPIIHKYYTKRLFDFKKIQFCILPASYFRLMLSLWGAFDFFSISTQQPQTGLIGRFYWQVENRPKKCSSLLNILLYGYSVERTFKIVKWNSRHKLALKNYIFSTISASFVGYGRNWNLLSWLLIGKSWFFFTLKFLT